jgi:hypothetical protein
MQCSCGFSYVECFAHGYSAHYAAGFGHSGATPVIPSWKKSTITSFERSLFQWHSTF